MNVGIGTTAPAKPLHVASGDVYLSNPASGVIIKSAGGVCARIGIDDTAKLVVTAVACP